jgi:uncharacterized delta-60 repeat protein
MAKGGGARTKGWFGLAGIAATAAAALAAAGDLDTSFGTGGIDRYSATGNHAADCVVQSDGKVLVAVREDSASTTQWRIDRRASSGGADTTWGTGGTVKLLSGATPKDLALGANGKILAVGNATVTTTGKGGKTSSSLMATVARLSSTGSVDFTTHLSVPNATASTAMAVIEDANGKIVVAGVAGLSSRKGTQAGIFVARLTSSGALDTTFGTNGITVNDVTSVDDSVTWGAIGIQSDGKIVVGGTHRQVIGSESYQQWDITRYTSSGAIDTAFGTVHGPGTYDADLGGLAIDASDRIVVSGARHSSLNASDMLVVRYTSGGSVDTSFGTSGVTTIQTTTLSRCGAAAIDGSGRIALLGYQIYVNGSTYTSDVVTARLTSSGAIDTSYGTGGVTAAVNLGVRDEPRGLALTSGGDVVVVGDAYDSSNVHTWFVARYLGN